MPPIAQPALAGCSTSTLVRSARLPRTAAINSVISNWRRETWFDASKYFRFDASVNYSADQNLVQETRFLVTYKGSCYTVFLEYRGLDLPPAPRRDIRLVVNLKDIGTLLDVNGSINALFGQ